MTVTFGLPRKLYRTKNQFIVKRWLRKADFFKIHHNRNSGLRSLFCLLVFFLSNENRVSKKWNYILSYHFDMVILHSRQVIIYIVSLLYIYINESTALSEDTILSFLETKAVYLWYWECHSIIIINISSHHLLSHVDATEAWENHLGGKPVWIQNRVMQILFPEKQNDPV